MDANVWDCNPIPSSSASLIWRNIIQILPLFSLTLVLLLEMGMTINSFGRMFGGVIKPLRCPSLAFFTFQHNWRLWLLMSFVLFQLGVSWSLEFSRDFFEWEIYIVAHLLSSLKEVLYSMLFLIRRLGLLSLLGVSHQCPPSSLNLSLFILLSFTKRFGNLRLLLE